MAKISVDNIIKLNKKEIDKQIPKKSPGAYILGWDDANFFYAQLLGRSDNDINASLKEHLVEGYKKFLFSLADSPKKAFEQDCKNFHEWGGGGEFEHPERPTNTIKECTCPYCNIYDFLG